MADTKIKTTQLQIQRLEEKLKLKKKLLAVQSKEKPDAKFKIKVSSIKNKQDNTRLSIGSK